MDDILGVSVKKFVEIILAILALVFLLIEKMPMGQNLILAIVAVVYLLIVVILALARRSDMFASAGMLSIEAAAGLLMVIWYTTALIAGGQSTLMIVAYVLDLIVGALFLMSSLF